jgi:hypothetical protein
MKILILSILLSSVALAQSVGVKSYIRKDGKVVKSHIKSKPNSTKIDNIKYKGRLK